jgi:hypothetical protein
MSANNASAAALDMEEIRQELNSFEVNTVPLPCCIFLVNPITFPIRFRSRFLSESDHRS